MLVGSDHCSANSQTTNFAMPSVLLIIRMAFGKVMWRRCVNASINLHDFQAEFSGGEAESVGARMRKFNSTALETIETSLSNAFTRVRSNSKGGTEMAETKSAGSAGVVAVLV